MKTANLPLAFVLLGILYKLVWVNLKSTTGSTFYNEIIVLAKSIIILSILCFVICIISYTWMSVSRCARMMNKFPQGPKLPILGSLYPLLGRPEDIVLQFSKLRESYGRVFGFWISHTPHICIMEAETAQKVLSSTRFVEKGSFYKMFKWFLGNGLVTSKAEIWRNDRKLLNPSFKYQRYDGFLKSFNKNSAILVHILNKTFSTGKEVVDLHPILCRCTSDFILESAMGQSCDIQKSLLPKFDAMTSLGLNSFRLRIWKPWLTLPILWDIFGLGRRESEVVQYFKEIVMKAITDRRQVLLTQNTNEEKSDTLPLIDVLLNTKCDEDILFHVLTFFGAGFETAATALNYTLYLLALNPIHQTNVHNELDLLFGDDRNRDVTFADLAEIKYLERCVKESMRLYPPVPAFMRIPDEDIPLENGLVIPKGCDVMFFPYEIHRDPRIFPSPELFDPDRFLPEACAKWNPCAYIPFSAGPRNCIGQKYGMLSTKTALAHILRHFKVSTGKKREDLEVILGMVLEPSGGIPLTLTRRSISKME